MVSSWVHRSGHKKVVFLLDGPAVAVFRRKLGPIEVMPSETLTKDFIQGFDFVLTGTGWASDLEKRAIRFGREGDIPVASYLDHWGDYRPRFLLEGELVLPDEVWVGDEDALRLARGSLGADRVKLVENPYFLDVREAFARQKVDVRGGQEFRILYICEAFAEAGRVLPDGKWIEFQGMDLFFDHLKQVAFGSRRVVVRLRPHPAEEKDKYASYLESDMPFHVEVSDGTSLIEDCASADWVVGMNSMALIIARIGGKKTYYCNPGGAKPKSIPATGLENFLETFDAV